MSRRHVPLRPSCAQPHECGRPLRMRVLAQVPMLAGLSEEDLDRIDRRMVSLSWAEGDPLFRAGDAAEHLYVLAAGRVKVSQPTVGGQEIVVDVLVPGELFGALGTPGEPPLVESAEALTTTCALRLDVRAFREILVEHPPVALRVLDDLARRLAEARGRLGRQSTSTVTQRVASVLLRLAEKVGQERAGSGGVLIQLPLTRADLAGMTGSTPESVSRAMSRFRSAGIIDTGRRWTAVLDAARLHDAAGPLEEKPAG
ncbi:Crp/Fnr family transcriptional regulator [Sanguibacter sp. 25GB23B1]|uniref:Crp/Fnr family transcriptional regulator n=1 Tax=unclassified Sanguibacter TaxID=2645534 RepID=UPI0032AEECF0